MDSELTLTSHHPFLFFLQMFVGPVFSFFLNPHVLTQNHVTGSDED